VLQPGTAPVPRHCPASFRPAAAQEASQARGRQAALPGSSRHLLPFVHNLVRDLLLHKLLATSQLEAARVHQVNGMEPQHRVIQPPFMVQ